MIDGGGAGENYFGQNIVIVQERAGNWRTSRELGSLEVLTKVEPIPPSPDKWAGLANLVSYFERKLGAGLGLLAYILVFIKLQN